MKRDTNEWWRSLTLKEQADYVEKKIRDKGKTPDRDLVIEDLVKKGQYRKEKPTISIDNWNDWCGTHVWTCAEAGDDDLWLHFASKTEYLFKNVDIVDGGEETHHVSVDSEHMHPYIEEGAYNG